MFCLSVLCCPVVSGQMRGKTGECVLLACHLCVFVRLLFSSSSPSSSYSSTSSSCLVISSLNISSSWILGARFRSVSLKGSAYFHSIPFVPVARHVTGHSRVKWISRYKCVFSQLPPHFLAPHLSPLQLLAFLSARIVCSVFYCCL